MNEAPITPRPRARVAPAVPVLFGAVVALIGATVYNFYALSELRSEVVATRELVAQQVAEAVEQVDQTAAASKQISQGRVEELRAELAAAREQAAQLAGDAKASAARHADDLAYKLQQAQEQNAAEIKNNLAGVTDQVSEVRQATDANRQDVAEVNSNLATVKSQADKTEEELRRTIAELQSARGDLGVQSGLIATNARQLQALKALGERDYIEFSLRKSSAPSHISDLYVRLKKADQKKNQFTLEVIVDDKRVEKKDRSANEPVQFIVPPATAPYELVVNEVGKDLIKGYISVPKVKAQQQARN